MIAKRRITVKDKQDTSKQQQQDFTLEAVLLKLEKIGIKVNLQELMKE